MAAVSSSSNSSNSANSSDRTFVADPVVPVELRLRGGSHLTLYQPGWHSEDGASAFPGGAGKVYVFGDLATLRKYVHQPAAGDHAYLSAVREWSVDDFAERLCSYDLVDPPEMADKSLDEHEQLSLGSTIALALDLLDQLGIDDTHADALRDDPDIGRLASGELLGGVFGSGKRRDHVMQLLTAHWSTCIDQISSQVGPPESAAEASADAPANGVPIEQIADAVTMWLALSEDGLYTMRTTGVLGGSPTYPAAPDPAVPDPAVPDPAVPGTERALAAWATLEGMQAALDGGTIDLSEPSFAGLEGIEVDLTPDDELIFDLVQIGQTIGSRLTVEEADRLVTAWTEVVRLASWGEWTDVLELALPPAPLGSYVVGSAIDRAQDRPGSAQAVATADSEAGRAAWTAMVQALETHIQISGSP